MFCITTEHKNSCDTFFNIWHKYYQLLFMGALDMSGHFLQKQLCQLVETFIFIWMQKMNSIPNFFFELLQGYCKLVTLSTFRMLDHVIKNYSITLWKTLMFICMQKINVSSYPTSLLRYCKDIANLLFWEL